MSSAKEKQKALDRLLEETYAIVHVNTGFDGVLLPEHLLKSPSVALKISRFFRGELTLGENELKADLLFGDDYFTCVVPLGAVWRITSEGGSHMAWGEDAPDEIVASIKNTLKTEKKNVEVAEEKTKPLAKRGHLKRVK